MRLFFRICFFNDTATTEIYTLSLHDALPIFVMFTVLEQMITSVNKAKQILLAVFLATVIPLAYTAFGFLTGNPRDRKSTRLNSSHANISYAVFCLKKKKT